MPRIRKDRRSDHCSGQYWRIGLYIRLSKEDEKKNGKEDDSESVINQEKILRDFVIRHFIHENYEIADVFIDDGLTGTDTSRPSFQRMKESITRKQVNCVIVKSLARGFRNLADQQKFLDEFIPEQGARFINIGNPFIDTFQNPRSACGLEIPLYGMFNEQFAAATSEEIRKTFRMKRERGEFIGSFAPYGYKKDPDNKNKLLIDEEAAGIVRSIFDWFVNEGYSKNGIARRLNQMGEPNPSVYKKKKGLNYVQAQAVNNDGLWTSHTIYLVLQNEMYTGAMVQGKSRVISYKVHKQVKVQEKDWYVVPGTHEAIIDLQTFEKAQSLNRRDTRTAPHQNTVHLMSGFVRCADCKKAMHRKTALKISYYTCRSYGDKKTCTKHTIREDKLTAAVLHAIQVQIAMADSLSEEIARISKAPVRHRESKGLTQSLMQAEKQMHKNNELVDALYLDWKKGEITQAEYQRLKAKISGQMKQLEQNIAFLKDEKEVQNDGIGPDNPYLTAFLNNKNIQALNRGILTELIDTVWVHKNGEITIDFNFADQYRHSCS